jgi:DUF4097 and DUF4098 domain-containing protein YvlB
MRARVLLFPLAAMLAGLTGCDLEDIDVQRYQADFHYSYPLKAGGSLDVETFNGSVEVTGWDENTVDISGTKYGPTQDAADSLRIDARNTADSVSVRAIRPSGWRSNLGAKFIIRMPRTAVLNRITSANGHIRIIEGVGPARLRTSNASIRVERLKGNVDAETSNASVELLNVEGDARVVSSNGHIRADGLRGSLDANTSNSGITARLDAGRTVRLDTSNGSVDLTLPKTFSNDVHVNTSNASITLRMPFEPNARVAARTNNSSITSDFPVRAEGTFGKDRLEGTLGSGGPLIDLVTSNGGIRLSRM